MKNLFFAFLLIVSSAINAQVGIGINVPDASAQLDITSTDKGILIPRMTASGRSGIVSPATGLLVFQTDGAIGFYYNAGTPAIPSWTLIQNSANVTTQGNTFNGANQLVQLNGSGQLPAISGSNLTNINAGNISSGTINSSRLGSGTANSSTFLRGDGTWASAEGNVMSMITANSSMTLGLGNQFVYITGSHTITLPANPETGQTLHLFTDNSNASINPNGKVFRQGGNDYLTSTINEFGGSNTACVILIYNGSKWFPLSVR